jgi:hypothetical protein
MPVAGPIVTSVSYKPEYPRQEAHLNAPGARAAVPSYAVPFVEKDLDCATSQARHRLTTDRTQPSVKLFVRFVWSPPQKRPEIFSIWRDGIAFLRCSIWGQSSHPSLHFCLPFFGHP